VPSRVQENQPTVILEALAAGSRVIASNVGGVGETLGQAGWLIPPGSPDALVSGVRSALASQEDKARSSSTRTAFYALTIRILRWTRS
jgi:glycosyltransferase involved in cell wall biosynthesis